MKTFHDILSILVLIFLFASCAPTPQQPGPPQQHFAFATKVPGKEGFVFSPYNNKVIDVRGIQGGKLVQDPYYPASEKKFFRVPGPAGSEPRTSEYKKSKTPKGEYHSVTPHGAVHMEWGPARLKPGVDPNGNLSPADFEAD